MSTPFQRIGLMGIPRKSDALDTHRLLYQWLTEQGYVVFVEEDLQPLLSLPKAHYVPLAEIGRQAQLAIVVGGDGNMLRAARVLSHHTIRIIGVNRGRLGFLTEINFETAIDQLGDVLQGHYIDEPRILLEVFVFNEREECTGSSFAINEVVLHPSKIAHMITYQAFINQKNAFMQHADGLIISTPTGSTAYSLSAGGPIISPELQAFIITPMFPHTLSARPLVIQSDSTIQLTFPEAEQELEIVCDSQVTLPVHPSDKVIIKKAHHKFNLIHGTDYDYFRLLSAKLGWFHSLT